MNPYAYAHLADQALLREFAQSLTRDCSSTATILALLAEIDARKLYLPAAHPPMFAYCVQHWHMSEDTAFVRIRVARTARRFPAIFPAMADGRLHLSAVVMLAPHLTPGNVNELLTAAVHKSKAEIERLLAERFPQSDRPTIVRPVVEPGASLGVAAQQAAPFIESKTTIAMDPLVPEPVVPSNSPNPPQPMEPLRSPAPPRAKLAPLAPNRFALQVTLDQDTHDQLRYAQSLLGHTPASRDVAQVLKRALDLLVHELERRKFAKAAHAGQTRPARRSTSARHVPAHIRRTVWERDGGQCTFVSENGKRCEERSRLEYDHVDPVARGGATSVKSVRLRCRAHNQYAAECVFGAEFMSGKREQARAARRPPPGWSRTTQDRVSE